LETLVLLDTAVVIDFLAGRSTAARTEKLLIESNAAVSVISIYELFNGVTNRRHIRQREQFIKLCEAVAIDAAIARKASSFYTALKKSGRSICNEDILIASCAVTKGYPLFTINTKHFLTIPGLILYEDSNSQ